MKKQCKWIEVLSAIAAILTALTSAWTLKVNIVERHEVNDLQSKANAQGVALSNALERVSLYGDIVAAEGGDRWAYKRAKEWVVAHSGGEKVSDPMIQKLYFSIKRFQDDATNNTFIANNVINLPPPLYDGANVIANLKSPNIYKRLNALATILTLRLNEYIPEAVDMAKDEPNLHVLQLLVYVVEKTFTDNLVVNDTTPVYSLSLDDCVFRHEDFKRHFTEMWNSAQARILARKHKEVRERPDPPRGNLVYIYDPEMPDSNK